MKEPHIRLGVTVISFLHMIFNGKFSNKEEGMFDCLLCGRFPIERSSTAPTMAAVEIAEYISVGGKTNCA